MVTYRQKKFPTLFDIHASATRCKFCVCRLLFIFGIALQILACSEADPLKDDAGLVDDDTSVPTGDLDNDSFEEDSWEIDLDDEPMEEEWQERDFDKEPMEEEVQEIDLDNDPLEEVPQERDFDEISDIDEDEQIDSTDEDEECEEGEYPSNCVGDVCPVLIVKTAKPGPVQMNSDDLYPGGMVPKASDLRVRYGDTPLSIRRLPFDETSSDGCVAWETWNVQLYAPDGRNGTAMATYLVVESVPDDPSPEMVVYVDETQNSVTDRLLRVYHQRPQEYWAIYHEPFDGSFNNLWASERLRPGGVGWQATFPEPPSDSALHHLFVTLWELPVCRIP